MVQKLVIPADVPSQKQDEFVKNYTAITRGTERLFLFAADQKLEHLNNDFYGPNIDADAQNPRHLFEIAQAGRIGAFATHLGLIARYGREYNTINYVVKLNGKTDCVPTSSHDPLSTLLWTIEDVVPFKKSSGLSICGVGYTIYLGSMYEAQMFEQAAQMVFHAHQHGLVAILWIYPRGAHIKDDMDLQLVAGAAGVAASLGADFVKIKAPHEVADLKRAVQAAGNTKVICSGGPQIDAKEFLKTVADQLTIGTVAGCAVGRNIFQKSLPEAIKLANEISDLVYPR